MWHLHATDGAASLTRQASRALLRTRSMLPLKRLLSLWALMFVTTALIDLTCAETELVSGQLRAKESRLCVRIQYINNTIKKEEYAFIMLIAYNINCIIA